MKDRLIAENICKTDTTVRPRKDEYLYNMDCVNEALVNLLVHNDWTITEPLVALHLALQKRNSIKVSVIREIQF